MALIDKLTAIGNAIREKNGSTDPISLKDMPVLSVFTYGIKDMAKQFLAQFLQQKILCFKMCIKGCPADIGGGNNLPHGNVFKIFLG